MISAALTYVLLLICPKSIVHYVVFATTMTWLLLVHAYVPRRGSRIEPRCVPPWSARTVGDAVRCSYNQYFNYMAWAMDSTGTQMVLTMKLSALA